MSIVTLDEARAYLRVDSDYEDGLIGTILQSASSICMDIARLSPDDWDTLCSYNSTSGILAVIRGEQMTANAVCRIVETLRIAILYAVGYLYEHREEADHHDLVLTLRSLLYAIREGVMLF